MPGTGARAGSPGREPGPGARAGSPGREPGPGIVVVGPGPGARAGSPGREPDLVLLLLVLPLQLFLVLTFWLEHPPMKNLKRDARCRKGRSRQPDARPHSSMRTVSARTRKTDNMTTFIKRRPAAAAQRRPRRVALAAASPPAGRRLSLTQQREADLLAAASPPDMVAAAIKRFAAADAARRSKPEGKNKKISKADRDLRLADVKEGWRLAAIKKEPSSSDEEPPAEAF